MVVKITGNLVTQFLSFTKANTLSDSNKLHCLIGEENVRGVASKVLVSMKTEILILLRVTMYIWVHPILSNSACEI